MKPLQLEILGKRITLKSDGSLENAGDVLELVRSKVRDIERRGSQGFAQDILLIALLEIAEEYVQSKKRVMEFKNDLAEKADRLGEMIEAELR